MLKKFFFLILLPLFALAAAEIKFPTLDSPVVDQVGILSAHDRSVIENLLYQYHQGGKAQIQVLIVPNLQGLPIEQYSIELLNKQKIGDEKRDDGILFLLSIEDHKMRIETGQGLEGLLTDLQSKRILENQVRPLFKSGRYAEGIASGVSEIITAIDPEYASNHPESNVPPAGDADERGGGRGLLTLVIIMIIILSMFRRRRSFFGLPFIGGFGGGFGGGGGGGGGWSGGGGGFSGGGASSDW